MYDYVYIIYASAGKHLMGYIIVFYLLLIQFSWVYRQSRRHSFKVFTFEVLSTSCKHISWLKIVGKEQLEDEATA